MSDCTINTVIEKDDGSVWGFYTDTPINTGDGPNISSEIGLPINEECCSLYDDYVYDTVSSRCYWKTTCEADYIKIILNPLGDDGNLFSVNDDNSYSLSVGFDYLLEFNTNEMINIQDSLQYKDIIEGLTLSCTIETVELKEVKPNVIYESPYGINTVYDSNIINIEDLGVYIRDTDNTGIRLVGDYISDITNGIKNSIGNNKIYVNNETFNSCWLRHEFIITDIDVINAIKNKKIKLGVVITNISDDFSLLIDKIVMNQVSEEIVSVNKQILKCPGFELGRVIDNRKSWISTGETDTREYNLRQRETKYNSSDSNLVINTKEIDLRVDPSLAIETNVFSSVSNNFYSICPDGYELNPAGDGCVFVDSIVATPPTNLGGIIVSGSVNSVYTRFGGRFYENITNKSFPIEFLNRSNPTLIDYVGSVITQEITTSNSFWGDGSGLTSGRLNKIGIGGNPKDEWKGFSQCFNFDEDITYYIGLAADNYCRFYINGELIINLDVEFNNNSFNYWHVFPYTFKSGPNIIEMEGNNDNSGSNHSFGFELYSASTLSELTGATNTTEAKAFWDTSYKLTDFYNHGDNQPYYDLGDNIGFTCPTDYSLCVDGQEVTCTKIIHEPISDCNMGYLTTTPLSSITSVEEFKRIFSSELIDVKNRQTLQSYPTLRLLYDKYLYPDYYDCISGGRFKYSELIKYSKSLGTYWTDIIEQLIPATTIWGSSYVYRNNIFDENKFAYKQYTLYTCDEPIEYGDTIAYDNDIEVITTEILDDGTQTNQVICSGVYLVDLKVNPEFRGKVITQNSGLVFNND